MQPHTAPADGATVRRQFFALLLVLGAIAACSDGPTSPSAASRLESVSGNAQPGFSGAPLEEPLIIRVLDVNGSPVGGADVSWAVTLGGGSVAPAQTVTDDNGLTQTTWTLGLAEGMQEVAASIAGVGSVRFTATASAIGPTCDGSPFDLPQGGSVLLVGGQGSEFCVADGDRDYLVVAFNSSRSAFGSASVSLSLTATGITALIGPPIPDPAAEPVRAEQLLPRELMRDFDFHDRLRQRERDELGPLVRRTAGRLESRAPSAAALSLANPTIGEQITLNANANNACTVPLNRTGRVVAISQQAIIVEDIGNPAGGFTAAEYQSIAATFDTLVHPVDVEHFGAPEDIDNNNRVVLFYTREVNALTQSGGPNGYIAGFFFARDLFPTGSHPRLNACPTSNLSEMMYLMVPDPSGSINGNVRTKDFVRRRTLATTAHEFEHLINSSRRLYVNTTSEYPERGWVEEGLAHSAEELVFFRSSGLNPGANIGASALQASSGTVNAFNDFQVENVLRILEHLERTSTNSAFQNDLDLATRGAAHLFFRYAVDRKGGSHPATWRALVNGPDTGFRNVEAVLQADPMQWMRDWAVSQYADDAVNNISARFRVPSWNLRSVVGGLTPATLYPLRPPAQINGATRSVTLNSGGSAYFRFGVGQGGQGRVTASVSAGPPPANVSFVVVRTR